MKKYLFTIFLLTFILPSLAHADITTGLVSWWKFDDGSGTSAIDSSGNSNTGTLSGSTLPSWVSPGKIGTYDLSFNGSTAYVAISAPSLTSTATLSIWVKTTNSHAQRTISFTNAGGSTVLAVTIGHDSSGGDANDGKPLGVYRNAGNSWSIAKSGTAINDGNWHLLTFVISGANGTFYVDGTSQSTVSNVDDTNTFSVYYFNSSAIGSYIFNGGSQTEYFNGPLDDVRIYSRALSSSDVTELYNYTGITTGAFFTNFIVKLGTTFKVMLGTTFKTQ